MSEVSTVGADTADSRSWTGSGVVEVAPGVHRIPLPMDEDGLHAVNVYAIDGGAGLTLIDGGLTGSDAHERLEASLARIGATVSDIRQVLVTHHHDDHYSHAVTLRRLSGTPIAIGRGEQEALRLADSPRRLDGIRSRLAAAGAAELFAPFREHLERRGYLKRRHDPPDRWLVDGEVIRVGSRRLMAVSTPGHTHGHMVFHEPDAGLMFTGDHLLPDITPSVGFEPPVHPSALKDFLGSLDRVLSLRDARMLPAHGPTHARTHDRARSLREHHRERIDQMKAAVTPGATARVVANSIRWTRRSTRLEDLRVSHQVLAIIETLVHLEHLADQNLLGRSVDGEIRRYENVIGPRP